jgi:methylamine---glutamate N-methyltransferase subunit B
MGRIARAGKSMSRVFDLAGGSVRELNQFLHGDLTGIENVRVENPDGAHSIAVGVDAPVHIEIAGHAGYYAAGMNKAATVVIDGNAGPGAAENMMSGRVEVRGFASGGAGASAHGGLLVIRGDAGLRCGISLKGADIVVGGDVGSFSGFMAQAGRMVVCGNAGEGLGDSLYEAVIYVHGEIRSLGADAHVQPMTSDDHAAVKSLLEAAGLKATLTEFKRVASARTLYHWNADADQNY